MTKKKLSEAATKATSYIKSGYAYAKKGFQKAAETHQKLEQGYFKVREGFNKAVDDMQKRTAKYPIFSGQSVLGKRKRR